MDSVGVTKAGNGAVKGSDALGPEYAQRYPGRFLPFAGQITIGQLVSSQGSQAWNLESQSVREYLDQLEREIGAGRWKGIGELFVNNGDTHPGWLPGTVYPADSPLMKRLWGLSVTYRIPLSVHMEADASSIAEMERLLASNRLGTWLWAHTGYTAEPALLRRLFQAHPNLYCELSWRDRTNIGIRIVDSKGNLREDWRELMEEFPGRFVIGTDPSGPSPGEYASIVRDWRSILSPLSTEAQAKIFHQNAARIIGG